jgi:hypothetical protein
MWQPTGSLAFKTHSGTVSVSILTMEHKMIKTIKLSVAVFATALLGGVALTPALANAHVTERATKAAPVRVAASASKEVEGTKADASEDKLEAARKMDVKAEAKADHKADKAEAKTDKVEAKMMRHHETEGTKADIAEDKTEAKLKK